MSAVLGTINDTVTLCVTGNKALIPSDEAAKQVSLNFNKELELLHDLALEGNMSKNSFDV